MHNEYRYMMEEITLSPAARSAIEEQLAAATPIMKHRKRHLRGAIAAVCICLLVPGTALGVEYLREQVSLGEQTSSIEEASYRVVADVVQWSEDSFSDALQEDLKNGTLQRIYNNKSELEEYLGISLIRSTELEEAGLVENLANSFEYGFDLRPQLALEPSARYILTASDLDGKDVDTDPQVLKVSSHRVMENSEIYLDAWIVMDSVTQEQLEEGILGENFPPVTMHVMDLLRDDEGNFILDKIGYISAEHDFASHSYSMVNGDTATIITARTVEPDGSLGFREYMGYFIHDGILYTVKPYAVYNPYLSYPSSDDDMLKVLKVVLDTFE